jgi:hypothetical protein
MTAAPAEGYRQGTPDEGGAVDQDDSATTPGSSLPSRRTVVRAAAHAAWLAPAVQLASAVPAYAASGDAGAIRVDMLMCDYASSTSIDNARPDQLIAYFSITNTSLDEAAQDLLLSVHVPDGFYDAAPVVLSAPFQWEDAGTVASPGGGWDVRITGPELAAQGSMQEQYLLIQPQDPVSDPPFLRWAGSAYPLACTFVTGNLGSTAASDQVAESAPTVLRWVTPFAAVRTDDQLQVTGLLRNIGRRTSGPVTMTIAWVAEGDPDSFWTSRPAEQATSQSWAGGALTGAGTLADPWTYTFTHELLACEPSGADLELTQIEVDITIQLGPGLPDHTAGRTLAVHPTAPHVSDEPVYSSYLDYNVT